MDGLRCRQTPMDGLTPVQEGQVDKLLLKTNECAELLGVSRSRLYELMNAGAVRSVVIGRSRRIPRAELERFVEQLETEQLQAGVEAEGAGPAGPRGSATRG